MNYYVPLLTPFYKCFAIARCVYVTHKKGEYFCIFITKYQFLGFFFKFRGFHCLIQVFSSTLTLSAGCIFLLSVNINKVKKNTVKIITRYESVRYTAEYYTVKRKCSLQTCCNTTHDCSFFSPSTYHQVFRRTSLNQCFSDTGTHSSSTSIQVYQMFFSELFDRFFR